VNIMTTNPNSENRSSKEIQNTKPDRALRQPARYSDFRLRASFGFRHSLFGIQGLNQTFEEQRAELEIKDARITTLEKELSELKQVVKRLSHENSEFQNRRQKIQKQ
jgi:septal ring factor EnvC (AmiA/AmiB activator)